MRYTSAHDILIMNELLYVYWQQCRKDNCNRIALFTSDTVSLLRIVK